MKIIGSISSKSLDELDDDILSYIKYNILNIYQILDIRMEIWSKYMVKYPDHCLRHIILYELNKHEIKIAYSELINFYDSIKKHKNENNSKN